MQTRQQTQRDPKPSGATRSAPEGSALSAPKRIALTAEIVIERPADQVWAVIADYARDPSWRRGVRSMSSTPAGLAQVGATTHESLRFAGKTWNNDGEVVAVNAGRRLEWRTVSGADADGSREVEPLEGGRCVVRLELNVEPHGFERLLAPILERMLGRNLAGDLATLRSTLVDD